MMNKKQLYIDTQFEEFNSTDVNNYQDKSVEYENGYVDDHFNGNFSLLDIYFQGMIKLADVFDRRDNEGLFQAFIEMKGAPGIKATRYKKGHQQPIVDNTKRGADRRDYSESLEKIKQLNDRADRLIEKRRLKSESKQSLHSNISNKEGKKILSKLDKLERIVKDIRREHQVSNHGSIVYASRSRYPEQFGLEGRRGVPRRRVMTEESHPVIQTRYFTDSRAPPAPYFNQAYPMHPEQYFAYQTRYDVAPLDPEYRRVVPSNIPYQKVFRQDNPSGSMRGETPQQIVFPRHHFLRDEVQQPSEMSEQEQKKEKHQVNVQLQQIKEQLNQLKQMNKAYISNNTIMMDEARNKDKDRGYQLKGKEAVDAIKHELQYQKKQSVVSRQSRQAQRQVNIHRHPVVPELNLRANVRGDTINDTRDNRYEIFPDQQFEHPQYYTHSNCEQYKRQYGQFANRHPQPLTERVHTAQKYITPLHEKHLGREPQIGACGQCGCRCHDNGSHRQPAYQNGRYQGRV